MKAKDIFCPGCNKLMFKYDGYFSGSMARRCERCEKLVIYVAKSDKIKVAEVPSRKSSSGVRFY